MSIVIAAQSTATAALSTVQVAATSTTHAVQALGNFAEGANVKSSAWLSELKEDTADLALVRQGLRQQRIAIRVASETAAIEKQIADPVIKKHYDDAMKMLKKSA